MAKPRLVWRYPSDDGTLTASSAAYGYEAARLQRPHLAEQWRSGTSAAAEWLKVDLGAAWDVDAFCLLGHDLDGTETGVTLEANATDSWGAPGFSRAVTHRAGTLVEFFATQSYRWWRLVFTKPSAGVSRSAGRLLLGPSHEFARRIGRKNFVWGYEDLSDADRTPGGQLYGDGAERLRSLRFAVERAPQALADEVELLYRTLGKTVPFVVSLEPDAYPVEWLLYGTVERKFAKEYVLWNGGAPTWDVGLELLESK